MNIFNKENKKTFYTVKIGYSAKISFTNQEEALALYRLLSGSISRVNVDHRMIDQFNGKDYSGYEYLYYIGRNEEVTLSTEEQIILSEEEVNKKVEKVRAEKEAFEASQKPKKKKKV